MDNPFSQYRKPIILERLAYGINQAGATQKDKKRLALTAIKYLKEQKYTNSIHWDLFLSNSGLKPGDVTTTNSDDGERDVILEKVIAHEYADALRMIESKDIDQKQYFQKLECIANVHMLAKDYHSIQELGNYLKDVKLNDFNGCEEQSIRYLRVLLCASYFSEGKFFECSSHFSEYVADDNTFFDHTSGSIFLKKEVILMATISSLVAIPLDNYSTFLYLTIASRIRSESLIMSKCMEPLIQTRFKDFFKYWNVTVAETCAPCFFVIGQWEFAQLLMRCKIYFFYLRISTRLEISYISKILNVDEKQTRDEIQYLIDSTGLNIQIVDDVISYKNKHVFQDAVETLKVNELRLESILADQQKSNAKLKDEVQQSIINNEESMEETVRREQANAIDQQLYLNEEEDDDDIAMDTNE
ncbi:similar to Saccharomyces cerevisiae YIL071C PCI8 Possible shared subunit of Cop9 signalosome (CSN) and eIF3, binds eIF3b subunit Prt1p [Maudiozyma saulgeensis]|uniref:Similar to Saccharomyces cerevisiae YIL071C PCI8 Possible shared subunit of Cop9 signalosome (CSN) and eIF3, binds eIF3b subunit Prt1p n=1 Tax=Maudiozyma saulgeensis TaxID=1789683 RepID=A0A1X7QY88_9SACH|nr:similar to Saccharomyces cerevisiae YIL071C PCI8 Possible shared subunit of Cop9 signalosome (CSN) and eIF3, binds eIF3b subunit Prt1p [Kazachstania saulgeensis]